MLSPWLEALAWASAPAEASGGGLLSSNKRWDYRPACKDCQPIWVKCKKRQEPQLIVKSRQVFEEMKAAAQQHKQVICQGYCVLFYPNNRTVYRVLALHIFIPQHTWTFFTPSLLCTYLS